MIYEFTAPNGAKSKCQLDIIDNLVVATELEDNEGMSITNACEDLATMVCKEFNIDFEQILWIEHYKHNDSYDRVIFDVSDKLSNPRWERIG